MSRALYPVAMARGEPPKYRQIADSLRARIESGEFPPGSALPSGTELEKEYKAHQATVRHAIDVLREAGYADPQHGVAVWVRQPEPSGPSQFDVLMGRVDEMSEDLRLLKERMSALEQERQ